ncbi:MAG: sensor domain-containing protein, partial [Acidimicrobiales bacterium]
MTEESEAEGQSVESMRATLAWATSIIDSSNEIIIVADLEGRVQEWNRGAETALGYSRQEMLGRPTRTYIDPKDLDRLGKLRELVWSGQEVREVLASLIRSDNKAIKVVTSGLPVRDHTGAVVGVATLSRDVTERLRIQHELELSEARFQALHRNSSDLAIVVNAKGKMTYVSPAFRVLSDRSPEEVLSLSGLDFIDPADHPVVRQAFARVFAEPSESVRTQARVLDRSGVGHWIELVMTNALDEPAIAGIVTNVRDITDRKEIELALAASEARFRGHFQYAAVGQAMTDVDGVLVDVNEAYCAITGYSREALLGIRALDITHPEDVADNVVLLERLLTGQIPSFQLEKRYVRKDGSAVDVANSVSLIRDDSGTPRFITVVVIDISERKRAEAELERLALYDTLTGLPNRGLIQDRLDQALARGGRHGDKVGVIALGVDRFKAVNNDLGRAAGDELLKVVADRLVGAVGETGTVARTGGDEFLVVCEDMADESVPLAVGHKIVDAFEFPIHLEGQETYLTVSAGVTSGRAGAPADRVVAQASAAMYKAKYLGRARVETFDGPTPSPA